MHFNYRVWKPTRKLAFSTQECVTCNLPKMASNIARSTWPARNHTHTHTQTTHTLSHSTAATLVALYEFIMNTVRTCRSSSAATTFFALRQRRFSTVLYLFNISFLFSILVFYLVCFGMTLTLSWETCLCIRNVAQKFYCINCCCYIFGTHSGQTDRNCSQ